MKRRISAEYFLGHAKGLAFTDWFLILLSIAVFTGSAAMACGAARL